MTTPTTSIGDVTAGEMADLMAAMAAGDGAALYAFVERHGTRLAGIVRRTLRDMGRHDVAADPDAVDDLVLTVAFAIFDRAGGWRPGAAAPWTWAAAAIRSAIGAHLGHRSIELDPDRHDTEGAPIVIALVDADDLFADPQRVSPEFACFVEALDAVTSPRDHRVVVQYLTQQSAGDPSPSNTVADLFDLTPANVRKIVSRTRQRLAALVTEPGFEPLAGAAWIAA